MHILRNIVCFPQPMTKKLRGTSWFLIPYTMNSFRGYASEVTPNGFPFTVLRNESEGEGMMDIEAKDEGVKLAIKYNDAGVRGGCPICGNKIEPKIPLALFMQDSWTEVCDDCGEKYAPELNALLNMFYALPISQRRTWMNLRLKQGR